LKDWKRNHKLPAFNFGEALVSPPFNLPHDHIIHAVGAVWHGDIKGEVGILKQCYISILDIAAAHNIKTLRIPNISTGIYGFPKQEAAEVALETLFNYQKETSIEEVFVVCYDEENFDINKSLLVEHKKC